MQGIIINLGAPNDEQGNLSDIALSRADKSIQEYHLNPQHPILCTGGYGSHFNTTDKPHAYYVQQYLRQREIPESDLLEIVESHDTVEDATLSRPSIKKYPTKRLIIVSSDFHMKRVRYIFERVFQDYQLRFSEAQASHSKEELEKLTQHEQRELERLVREGI